MSLARTAGIYTRPQHEGIIMNRVIVIEFTTLDGIVDDPDGSDGTPYGGWAFRYGPEAVAGDPFELVPRLSTGALVLGRATWELFSKVWPARSDDFSVKMNTMPKWVASHTLTDVSAWNNSTLIQGDVTERVRQLRRDHDVILMGSLSVVHTLMRADMVDEYRLLVFPAVLGEGRRLFTGPTGAGDLRMVSAEPRGAAARLRYERQSAH
jgi:dihydrofolate reductase